MTTSAQRIDPESFDKVYRSTKDPWNFESSWYELRKYQLSLAILPDPHYRRCFEPGASIGVLSQSLARRCDQLVTIEASPTAVNVAKKRLKGTPNVEVRCGSVPEDWPDETFDLLVLSEIGYYFDHESFAEIAGRCSSLLDSGGTVLAAHWLGNSPDHLRHGNEVHSDLLATLGTPTASYSETAFRAETWQR